MATGALTRIPQEILEQICGVLVGRSNVLLGPNGGGIHFGPRACETVAALARTCRLFHEPALNVLWHTIPDIALLFFTMPRKTHLVRKLMLDDKDVLDDKIFMFAGTPEEVDLQRFFTYARRVKALDYRCYHLPKKASLSCAHSDVYVALAALLHGRPLLPNIKRIHYFRKPSVPSDVFRAFDILFAPTLRQLTIHSRENGYRSYAWIRRDPELGPPPSEETAFVDMLARLNERVPRLEMLELNLYPSSAAMAAGVSANVCASFRNLISLRLNENCLPIGPEGWEQLGCLVCLRHLVVSTPRALWTAAGNPVLPARSLFVSLESLTVTVPGGTLALPTQLIRCVASPELEELSISVEDDVPRCEIDALFSTIAALPARDRIATLYVEVRDVFHTDGTSTEHVPPRRRTRAPDPIGAVALEPLTALRSLEDVMLDIHCPFDLDDALLERLGAAWPQLERLIIGTHSPWGKLASDIRVGEMREVRMDAENGGNGGPEGAHHGDAPAVGALDGEDEGDPDEEADSDDEDEDVGAMDAWTKPRATLLGVLAFTCHTPRLAVLGLEFDATLSFVPRAHLTTRVPRRPLDTLFVGLSPIADPWVVAAVLSDAFPEFAEVENGWEALETEEDDALGDIDGPERAGWSPARLYGARWEKVCDLVPRFAKVRRDERRTQGERDRRTGGAAECAGVDASMALA
ncbi:uncharacterized protein TRAVEDRAFT_46643 [Trametes versicolor FP-101664 SS1]|uniref:uncharacterized protein n=1 Tax=Trametes versicolor (strain FP-101664) TaxID=717944 RepID=UPI0004624378|nr:uncharacterized protein TRAVEDRAFT_46643 [Trametes versicolor FP-101664 SS1]EIW59338.1 hypothetical protein TRAVEDRAFT_46643 [Trametes versicolor FP-101664 SS1]